MARNNFFLATTALLALVTGAHAATIGKVIPIAGEIADIALDQNRGLVYAASLTSNRIEVISMSSQALQDPIVVANQPSSVALSPDGHYLVVGHYVLPGAESVVLTIVDLTTSTQRTLGLGGARVLAVAFGNGPQALVIATDKVRLLDPATATVQDLIPFAPTTSLLPVPWATFPPQILQASAGVSGDGNTIYALVTTGATYTVARYEVLTHRLTVPDLRTSPSLGPIAISVDQAGDTFLAGWVLSNASLVDLAEFPYPSGSFHGGHAFDSVHNVIYAQIPRPGEDITTSAASGMHLLHVVDTDNLTVREILRLRENFRGKALLNGDTMYAISDSGVTILPIAAASGVHRVKAIQEDLLFQADGCSQGAMSQFMDIVDPSGGATDFSLSVSTPGVKLVPSSGTTPARVQVVVDPTAFQDKKGTTAVAVQIVSSQAVNVPQPVRLLVNTRNPNQQGTLSNVPGTLVDVLADPTRNRFYVLRQDKNQVLVFDGTTFEQIPAVLRTGNTPVQMAIVSQKWLLVTNDHSQLISVFDLDLLAAVAPVLLPTGVYARAIAIPNAGIITTTRTVTPLDIAPSSPTGHLFSIDFSATSKSTVRLATTGIYVNSNLAGSALVASPSGRMMFMVMPDGTVNLFDSTSNAFVSSRQDVGPLSGAYTALSDDLFLAGNHVFNSGMVNFGDIDLAGGASSGATVVDGSGLITTTSETRGGGVIERFSLDQFAPISPVRIAEAASTAANLTTIPTTQVGQTILPFTRTLAPLANGQSIVQLSTSGITKILRTFDAAVQPPSLSAVTNAADYTPGVAPGGLITIWGKALSAATAAASALPLPKGLGGVCVYVNSVPLPLLFVSPAQINAQLPFDAPSSARLTVSSAGGQSSPLDFTVQPTAPAIFSRGPGSPIIVRTVDGKLITDATPIHLNEILIIYLTGLGAVDQQVNAGDAAPSNPPAVTIVKPVITIGGAPIFTLFSGLAPGLAGVNQINAQVPFHHIPTGSKIPFTITQGGASTTVIVRVEE